MELDFFTFLKMYWEDIKYFFDAIYRVIKGNILGDDAE